MAAVQQSAEALIQERRAILKDLLVMINNYDKARHAEVGDKFAEKAICYFNIIASQQKNKADALERADLFLSDLALETTLCIKICSDDNDRTKKILSLYDGYEEARKLIEIIDQTALDKQSFVEQIITEFWGGIPTIAVRQQNKNMAKKVPAEIRNLVENVLTEIENCPKEKQTKYEGEFNRILMDILNNVSEANKQNKCKIELTKLSVTVVQEIRENNKNMAEKMPDETKVLIKRILNEIDNAPKQHQSKHEQSLNKILISVKARGSDANLSEKIVHDMHKENKIMLAEIKGKILGSAYDSLERLRLKINAIPLEQRGEYEIQFKNRLTETLNIASVCKQKEKEYKTAVANEKSRHVLRMVAIVGAGVVATIGLAALSFFTFGAALPHAVFLGGLGLTAMIKTLEYNDNKKDKNLWQLRSDKNDFIKKTTESVAKENEDLLRALNTSTHNAEQLPQPQESNRDTNRSALFKRPTSMGEQIATPNSTNLRQR